MSRTARQQEIRELRVHRSYRPYDRMPEYWQGFNDYGTWPAHPYPYPRDGVKAQAYDRGLNAAMRIERMKRKA